MSAWSKMAVKDVSLEVLAQVIRETGRPVHVNVLARAAVRARLESEAEERRYAPGAHYSPGETIRFNGQSVMVEAVNDGSNPKQGQFKILTLVLSDGTVRYMAAEVPGALAEDRQPMTDDQVRRIIEEHGLAIRTAVQEALGADDRFVWFQDTQGDHWCLAEMLPEVGYEELAQVWPLLRGLLADGTIHPRVTEELVKAIWGQENDGSDAYLLKAFALNAALQRCRETRWLGDGWVLEAEWQELQERPVLVGPREENVVQPPTGVTPDDEEEEEADEDEEETPEEQEEVTEEDLEAWRRNRLLNATITLGVKHYYGNWLPLTRDMRRVFPPRASRADVVTFYHRFGGEEGSFSAWIDWDQKRILGSPQMYQAVYEHGIYPGAKLVISHRDSEREYDIRTKPIEGEQRILVRRVFLAEDGTLEYEEVEEPVRYEIAKDVFVAAARWEDLKALFRQAEEVGAGIFQLMYEKCCQWWEERGRQPLYVTADELFQAIHFDDQGRLTSKATIAWELWRRLAFKPVGGGRYLFRPEYVDRVRPIGPRRRASRPRVARSGPEVRKDRSLQEIVQKAQVTRPSVQDAPQQVEPVPLEGEETFWEKIARLEGRDLCTLDQKRPFRILSVADQSIEILVGSSGEPRTIRRKDIEDAWRHLVTQGELSRSEIHARYSEFNPAYVAAILAELPNVTHLTEPIRLHYRQQPKQEESPVPSGQALEVSDIGIRHIVYPIPFSSVPLSSEIREAIQEQLFGYAQPGLLFLTPEVPEKLDEYLMQRIADKDSNRFVTPRPVVDFMVNLAQPKPGERVADICCGTGIFLVKALRFVKEVYGEDADLELYGADIYDKAVEATRLNLQANGARNFTVVQADSLREQGGIFAQKYDLILGNPPFAGGQCQQFIRRWVELLKDDGRVAVNVSEGILANTGQADRGLRRWLVNNFEIEAVISLPRPRTSQQYGAKSNVLFLRRAKPEQPHETFLVQVGDYAQIDGILDILQGRK